MTPQPTPSAGGSSGGGGAPGGFGGDGGSGGTGGDPIEPGLGEVTAPTQTEVRVELAGDATDPAFAEASSYAIAEAGGGSLAIDGVSVADGVITITTAKQKLGVTYELTLTGTPLAGAGESFLAADSADFWTFDYSSPNFADKVVTATRRVVGEHVVVYVEEGMQVAGLDAIATEFDEVIYPIENALFTEPPDQDDNGRIVVLGLDGQNHYAGYFNPLDSFSEAEAQQFGYHSNEMELLYMNAASGQFQLGTLAHEYQHLLFNEEHGLFGAQWSYHNEGLSECAEHVIYGQNPTAVPYLAADPLGAIADGVSLVHWEASYDHYIMAYMFWTYIASQQGGEAIYGELFALDGHPSSIDAYLQQLLGKPMTEVVRDTWVAMQVQSPTGPLGFEGMIDWNGAKPPVSPNPSVSLPPFGGVLLAPGGDSVLPTGAEGLDISFTGINGAGEVGVAAPFDLSGGGVLVAVNMSDDADNPVAQPVGFDLPLVVPQAATATMRDPAWHHPPPANPYDGFAALRAWRERTRER